MFTHQHNSEQQQRNVKQRGHSNNHQEVNYDEGYQTNLQTSPLKFSKIANQSIQVSQLQSLQDVADRSKIHHKINHEVVQRVIGEEEEEDAPLLPESESINEQFNKMRTIGRLAAHLETKIKSRRRDEIIGAGSELAKVWVKASIFMGLDLVAPGLGTGLGVVDATQGAASNINEKSKVERGQKEGVKSGLEYTAGGLATGAGLAGESVHWTVGAGIGSVRAMGKAGKAALQSNGGRKANKIAHIHQFKGKLRALETDIFSECDDLIAHFTLGSNSSGPSKSETQQKERIIKAKGRIASMCHAMDDYLESHSEHEALLGGMERSTSE